MAIQLSRAQSDVLWQQANPMPQQSGCAGFVETLEYVPPQLGQGYTQWIQWREIDLLLFNYKFHDDVHIIEESSVIEESSCEFGFNLSGNLCGKHSGENFVEWGTDNDADEWTHITYANDPILKVDIHLEAVDPAHQLIAGMLEALPLNTRRCIEDRNQNWFSEINVITPAMRLALEQILHCPFQGRTKQMYLESKCLELIALKIEQIKEAEQASSGYSLNSDDIERIYAAKKILVDNPDQPPSLMALARQVSLNDYKLKVGFKAVFGTTVFGCLHQHRMETARRLLCQGSLNVKEVAQTVGYGSQSRFAVAFRKQFGINPKAYHLSRKSG
ncbi:MAG: helix-turn-helix transcriptional regulator [Acaryochloridaceae cyanobacterium CSU_3_4]|nr:helix-turn-helix transcriptional regulator [Acaryochloridaceae cyanobacterium CSU_3_4]